MIKFLVIDDDVGQAEYIREIIENSKIGNNSIVSTTSEIGTLTEMIQIAKEFNVVLCDFDLESSFDGEEFICELNKIGFMGQTAILTADTFEIEMAKRANKPYKYLSKFELTMDKIEKEYM